MEKDSLQFIAKDVFLQAEDGLAVSVDPDVADAFGALQE